MERSEGKNQDPRSGTGFCPSRSEAARREQAQRDNIEAQSAREQGHKSGAEGKAQGGAAGPGWVSPQSENLWPVAEGAQRDNIEARRSVQPASQRDNREGFP